MKWIKRTPDEGYLDGWLWLPKHRWSEAFLRSNLVFANPRKDEAVISYYEEPHHWRVPRNFVSPGGLAKLPYRINDARFRGFPPVSLRSSVVLDAKYPDKDFQQQGSRALLAARDGILSLRCGAGKTVVALHSAAQLGVPVLVLVDDKGLAEQWRGAIVKFLGVDIKEIGRCYGGRFKWEHPITVASVQTIARRVHDGRLPPELAQHFGCVILDEAHTMGAPYFSSAVPPFQGRRWALSATPTRDDEFDSLLRYTVGGVLYSYMMPDLKPTVLFKELSTPLVLADPEVREAVTDTTGDIHNGRLFSYLSTREDRVSTIENDIAGAISKGRTVVVLSHSRQLVEELGRRFENRGGGVTHGGIKAAEHARVVAECNPLIAIMKRGKQALDKEDLDTCFLCEPFTKAGTAQQVMGRLLRPYTGKKKPVVVIYEDKFIAPMRKMCKKLRATLDRWPERKGGRIPYKKVR